MEKWFSNIFKYDYCPQPGLYINVTLSGKKYSCAQLFQNGTMEVYETDDVSKPTKTFLLGVLIELPLN